MAALLIKPSPTIFTSIIQEYFMYKPIYLGLITSGNRLDPNLIETVSANFLAAEYASGSWVRPSMTISNPGTFNGGLDVWEFPTTLEWSFVGPIGGLSVEQIVISIGGASTPRNTAGVVVGVATYATPLLIPAGVTQSISAPWTIA